MSSLLQRMNAAANEEASLQQSLAYDYSRVAEADRQQVIDAALEIKPRLKRASEDLVEVGKQLNAVKDFLPHGQWEIWLETEFSLSIRTARNFMGVAERFGGKSANFADFNPSVLYALAAPSTPDAAVDEVVEVARSTGKSPNIRQVKEAITRHKPPPPAYQPPPPPPAEPALPAEPATMQPPPDLAVSGWDLRKLATNGGVITGSPAGHRHVRKRSRGHSRHTGHADRPSAAAAEPTLRLEIEALLLLYTDAHKSLPVFHRIMGYESYAAEMNILDLIRKLKKKLRKLGGQD